MYMRKLLLSILLSVFCTSISVQAESQSLGLKIKPHLGKKLENFTSIIVSPDGSGLPKGSGTVAEGAEIYLTKCAACHGLDGKQKGNQLVGGIGSLASAQPLKTVGSYWPYATTLYDYIARAMPYNLAKSLTADRKSVV